MSYRLTTDKTWSATTNELAETMRKWGVRDYMVTNDLPVRSRTKQYQTLSERLVVLKYIKDGTPVQLVMDTQSRAVDNFRVLYLAVEAMRMNDQRGLTDVVRQAYAQLPAPVDDDAYAIVGARPEWANMADIEQAYHRRARQLHPDKGGTHEQMARLNAAMEQIRKERAPV